MTMCKLMFWLLLIFLSSTCSFAGGGTAADGRAEDPVAGDMPEGAVLKTFPVEIKLMTPLTIRRERDMRFPVQIAGWSGQLTSTGSGLIGSGQNATFSVTGERGEQYVIGGLNDLIITTWDGRDKIRVNLLVSDKGKEGQEDQGGFFLRVLNDEGLDSFEIEGRATLSGVEAAGLYTGIREIMVGYY